MGELLMEELLNHKCREMRKKRVCNRLWIGPKKKIENTLMSKNGKKETVMMHLRDSQKVKPGKDVCVCVPAREIQTASQTAARMLLGMSVC